MAEKSDTMSELSNCDTLSNFDTLLLYLELVLFRLYIYYVMMSRPIVSKT